MSASAKEVWDAVAVLDDYAIRIKNERLYQAIQKVAELLEDVTG